MYLTWSIDADSVNMSERSTSSETMHDDSVRDNRRNGNKRSSTEPRRWPSSLDDWAFDILSMSQKFEVLKEHIAALSDTMELEKSPLLRGYADRCIRRGRLRAEDITPEYLWEGVSTVDTALAVYSMLPVQQRLLLSLRDRYISVLKWQLSRDYTTLLRQIEAEEARLEELWDRMTTIEDWARYTEHSNEKSNVDIVFPEDQRGQNAQLVHRT